MAVGRQRLSSQESVPHGQSSGEGKETYSPAKGKGNQIKECSSEYSAVTAAARYVIIAAN